MSESVLASYSALESNRFGYKIYRGFLNKVDALEALSFLSSEQVDIAILRIPSVNLGALSRLDETGIPYLVADTLVYYYCDLATYEIKQLKNYGLNFIAAEKKHQVVLDELVKTIFKDYQSHYSANPYLNKQDILEGYQEWARNYINTLQSGWKAWIIYKDKEAAGFVTCSFDNDECEGVLYGVHPKASGAGTYSDLIRFTQKYFKERGCKTMKVSTQVHNYAVQKVWVREGFFMKESYNTVHVNCFFCSTLEPVKEFRVWGRDIPNYLNPFFVKQVLAETFPELGNNCYVNTHRINYLNKIDDNDRYQIAFSFPYKNLDELYYKVLVKVLNNDNKLCQFAYYDIRGDKL